MNELLERKVRSNSFLFFLFVFLPFINFAMMKMFNNMLVHCKVTNEFMKLNS